MKRNERRPQRKGRSDRPEPAQYHTDVSHRLQLSSFWVLSLWSRLKNIPVSYPPVDRSQQTRKPESQIWVTAEVHFFFLVCIFLLFLLLFRQPVTWCMLAVQWCPRLKNTQVFFFKWPRNWKQSQGKKTAVYTHSLLSAFFCCVLVTKISSSWRKQTCHHVPFLTFDPKPRWSPDFQFRFLNFWTFLPKQQTECAGSTTRVSLQGSQVSQTCSGLLFFCNQLPVIIQQPWRRCPFDLTKHHSEDFFFLLFFVFLPHYFFLKPKHDQQRFWLVVTFITKQQTNRTQKGKNLLCDANEAPPNDQRWLSRINSLTRRLSSISPSSNSTAQTLHHTPHLRGLLVSLSRARLYSRQSASAAIFDDGSHGGAESKARGMLVGEPQRSAAGS